MLPETPGDSPVNVPVWLWFATIGGLVAVILADLFLVDHKPHAVTIKEAARWVLFYVALAVLFGLGIWYFAGGTYAGEFFAGYITEYSLSVDNLFVFVIIMSSFAVPVIHQHRVLLPTYNGMPVTDDIVRSVISY